MNTKIIFVITWIILVFQFNARADIFYLKNGDRITGEVVSEDDKTISIETAATGPVTVKREFIKNIIKPEEGQSPKEDKKIAEVRWDRNVSAGYNVSSGNTKKSQAYISSHINRNRYHVDEWTLGGDLHYSSSEGKMDAQKWYSMGRYAFNFGRSKRWYNFYKIATDHDRFANIDYRLLPSAGVGYWFFDTPGFKTLIEVGLGWEHTDYRDNKKDKEEAVLTPRAFFEKQIFGNAKITENLILYPALEDFSQYRLRSETVFTISLNERLALDISLIDNYNSDPPEDIKENDLDLISSLTYSF